MEHLMNAGLSPCHAEIKLIGQTATLVPRRIEVPSGRAGRSGLRGQNTCVNCRCHRISFSNLELAWYQMYGTNIIDIAPMLAVSQSPSETKTYRQ